jgi:hypothetical protein
MMKFDTRQFNIDMDNVMKYSMGFIEGVELGKKAFMSNLGVSTIEAMKQFIDSNARVNPEMLHHMYEWNRSVSPNARLFNIEYSVIGLGLSVRASFRQSTSVRDGSTVPFYDKARIMEQGIPVTIKPKSAKVLAFEVDGEEVFTGKSVRVESPGGEMVVGSFEKVFDSFFLFFSQSFLRSSGIAQYLENPIAFKANLPAGKRGGKSVGKSTGYRWIVSAGLVG